MNILKIEYEIDTLLEIVDERIRLIDVLHMQPSKNDNMKLKKHLNQCIDLLKEYENDVMFSEQEKFEELVSKYNEAVESLPDGVVDRMIYHFELKPHFKEQKKVRFKEQLLEEYEQHEPSKSFKPYKDHEEDTDDSLDAKKQELLGNQEAGTPQLSISKHVSNHDIFIQQQQQLMEQETHLSGLSDSISRTHGISLEINQEVGHQNEGLLTDLERQVDRSEGNLQRAGRRLDAYRANSSEKNTCFIIVILTVILFILLII